MLNSVELIFGKSSEEVKCCSSLGRKWKDAKFGGAHIWKEQRRGWRRVSRFSSLGCSDNSLLVNWYAFGRPEVHCIYRVRSYGRGVVQCWSTLGRKWKDSKNVWSQDWKEQWRRDTFTLGRKWKDSKYGGSQIWKEQWRGEVLLDSKEEVEGF